MRGIKHFVGVITALATTLMIAAFARISLRGAVDLLGLGWLIGAAMAIWFSSYPLDLLEAEDRND